MATESPIDKLPLPIISNIISFLRSENRRNASLVCKTWYEAAHDPKLLTSTFIELEATNTRCLRACSQNVISGLGKRKVPNLTITFHEEGDSISPDYAPHLASGTKHIQLIGKFTSGDIIFVIQNFPNLKSLKVEPYDVDWSLFFGTDVTHHKIFGESLGQLEALIFECPVSFLGQKLANLMGFLTMAKNLSLHANNIHEQLYFQDEYSLMPGDDFVQLLKSSALNLQTIQELDLRWVYILEEEFQEFVSIPDLKNLRVLKYFSWTGGNRNLISLSNSDMILETLEVECQRKDQYYLRYPGISSLLTKKESLRSITCRDIMYKRLADESSQSVLECLLQEWPTIHKLKIWPAHEADDDDEEVDTKILFKVKKDVNGQQFITMDIWTPDIIDNQTLSTLGQSSPGLQDVAFVPRVNLIDFPGLCMMADTFSKLTTLSLDEHDMAGVNLSALGAPLKNGGSRLTNLKSLSLGYCRNMRDETLLGLHFPKLKHLWLTNSTEITDRAVISIASSNHTLQLFSIASCSKVTNKGIRSIATNLKYLRCLLISDCVQLTGDVGFMLAEHCHNLEFLDVAGCSESVIELANCLPDFEDATLYCSRVLDTHDLGDILTCVMEDDWGLTALIHASKEAFNKLHGGKLFR